MLNIEVCVVAVDGPSASGKSTVSRLAAEALGYVYVDSGSLYRGITWQAVQEGVDVKDADAVSAMLERMDIQFMLQEKSVLFTIDGVNPGQAIRGEAVRERVSDIAALPVVRAFVVERLREMTVFGKVVMEGRDIGSVVFPHAKFKYYLDADPEERARRRHQELVETEGPSDVGEVLHSLQRRDQKDTTRKTAPLQIALGARVVNTTAMSIEDVVALIVREVQASGVEP